MKQLISGDRVHKLEGYINSPSVLFILIFVIAVNALSIDDSLNIIKLYARLFVVYIIHQI